MNTFLFLFGALMVITPMAVVAQQSDLHDLVTRFSHKQLITLSAMARSGITFVVIALVMMLWI